MTQCLGGVMILEFNIIQDAPLFAYLCSCGWQNACLYSCLSVCLFHSVSDWFFHAQINDRVDLIRSPTAIPLVHHDRRSKESIYLAPPPYTRRSYENEIL